MSDSLTVLIGDHVAGRLTRLTGGRLRFDYDEEYRERRAPTPLSVSMPVQIRSHSDPAVTPWLWGLLPDNEGVLARWARQFHASASSPFSMLATPIGHDCAGAVRFATTDEVDQALTRSGEVTWLTNAEVGQRLRELREDATAWLGRDFTGQFSLAGAQAKTALLYEDNRWGVPSGSAATSHILKPAVAGFDDHDLNEHLCLDAARRAGLVVARTRIARFGGESAIVVALCGAYAVMLVAMYALTRGLFRVDFEWPRLGLVVGVAGGLAVAGELLLPAEGAGGFAGRVLVLAAILPLLAAAGFFRPGERELARSWWIRMRRGRVSNAPTPG